MTEHQDVAAKITEASCRELLSARSSDPHAELPKIADVWVTVASHPAACDLSGHLGSEVRRLVAVVTTYLHMFVPTPAFLLSDRFETEALAWRRTDDEAVIVDVVDPDSPGGASRFRIPQLQALYRDCGNVFESCAGIRVISALAPTASRLMTSPQSARLSPLLESGFWPLELPTERIGGLR